MSDIPKDLFLHSKARIFSPSFSLFPRQVLLVRHAQSEGNLYSEVSERLKHVQRSAHNYVITDIGHAQAHELGQYLKGLDLGTHQFVTSTLTRAQQTLISAIGPEVEFILDSRLNEKDNGVFTELHPNSLDARAGFAVDLSKKQDWLHNRPAGGESTWELVDRLRSFMIDMSRQFHDYDTVVLVGHGRAIRVLRSLLHGDTVQELAESMYGGETVENCSVQRLVLDGDAGKVRCKKVWKPA